MIIRENTLQIKNKALQLGFNDCGISKAGLLAEESAHYTEWLNNGYHAGLSYMSRNSEKRFDPRKLVDDAKSVISVILNYFPAEIQNPDAPVLSKYAYGADYHIVIKEKLKILLDFIRITIPGSEGRFFTDSAPVHEHSWARRSGLGWTGKNSLLITRKSGSFVFIGEVIINTELEYDEPARDLCGTCTRCISACPTGAIISAYKVDARKCISYHTIENKTESIPESFRNKFMDRIFGCDICQDVCPWNQKLKPHSTKEFNSGSEVLKMTRREWYSMDEEKFNTMFRDSAVKRAEYQGIRRNLEFLI